MPRTAREPAPVGGPGPYRGRTDRKRQEEPCRSRP